jgi:acyl-CoA synthetase (AMP-forming)/AMP-acid ligase II
MCSLNPTDRVYCPLPLYHSAGGMLGVGACITSGSCLVVRKKFSVRSFSSDCAQFGCNKMQYIGELCRYLAHAPYNSDDQDVKLEAAFGNGLRPDVWTKFKDRYNIKQVVEFYASTEGNLATFNTAGKVGALGFVPRFFNFVYPVKIVKPSLEDSSIPLRGNDGKCVPADVDESGLVLGEINDNRSDRRFDGYTDTTATESKILVNVFQEGDKYFNTGDLLSQDQLGFFYWGDRVGDTFRWKGENVSTSEVEVVIDFITDIEDCCCYGVIVPGYDGRAGCVAVTLNQDTDIDHFSWDEFKLVCSSNLQPLSRPVFVKFVDSIPVTSTFKHKKTDLLAQGIAITDDSSLFVWSAKEKEYIPFDEKVLQDLQDGNFRL